MPIIMGIDIGGTGIKGAPVDTDKGVLVGERFRVLTPQPALPETMIDNMAQIVEHFDWHGEIGIGYPGVIKAGHTMTAANLEPEWIGLDAKALIEHRTKCQVTLGNDADVAGLAEIQFGAGRGHNGVVIMVTLGTGIGTAIFVGGRLLPNTELGHIEIRGKDAEKRAAERVRLKKDLSWSQWAERVDEYLHAIEDLFWPDLIIIGGGASKNHEKFLPQLTLKTEVVPAATLNEAGIIGAALWAEQVSELATPR